MQQNLSAPKFIDIERGRFAYREGGDPNGAPLVMLHGWPESSYCWEAVAAHIKPGLRLIAPDLRGLGDSNRQPDRECYRKTELAADMLQLLDALGVGDFQLAGHDWGGVVAQEVALAAPERVRKLVIMNIVVVNNFRGNQEATAIIRKAGSRFEWYQRFQREKHLAEAMIPGNEETWLRHFLRLWNREPFPEDAIREYVRYYSIPGTPGCGANYYRTLPDDRERWVGLKDHVWSMPSLYIYGNKDAVIVPEYLNHLEQCFRSIQVKEIEAGHFVQEEQPAAVAEALNDFLDT
ncbi:MAG: alpha/beta hydrolase [Ectothiorhodospiraceae bacterium]|nr:alpha/beta hydrolase [Ectothiorhodospiraceae bacterium]MCH8506526.1 alpha/beta hydrolase [Ectothiorhodospiraceae bacterium]